MEKEYTAEPANNRLQGNKDICLLQKKSTTSNKFQLKGASFNSIAAKNLLKTLQL